MDEIVIGLIIAVAPAWAVVNVAVAKFTLEIFSSADVQAITERANPSIVPK
jgi:hypothetical protein